MRLIAHRGFAGEAPENTVGAVREAARWADAVEVDVRAAADGEPVVIHDERVDRVTPAEGRVDGYTAAELGELEVLDSGEGIPHLREVLAAVPVDVAVNVELKDRAAIDPALAEIADVENDIVISSFDPETLQAIPDVPTAYLTRRMGERPVATADRLGCAYLHPDYRSCLLSRVVARAHEAGLGVNAWTVQRRSVAVLLRRRNVDGVIADYRL